MRELMRGVFPAVVLLFLVAFAGCTREDVVLEDRSTAAIVEAFGGLTSHQFRGRRHYERHCLICHGSSGTGDGFNAYKLNQPPPDFSVLLPHMEDGEILKVIDEGSRASGKSALCPPRRRVLSPEDQKAVLSYLRTLAP